MIFSTFPAQSDQFNAAVAYPKDRRPPLKLTSDMRVPTSPDALKNSLRVFQSNPTLIAMGSEHGCGIFSSVYAGPTPDTVVKVSHDLGDGWLSYAGMILDGRISGSHCPNILALHVDYDKGEYRAIMERLIRPEENMPYVQMQLGWSAVNEAVDALMCQEERGALSAERCREAINAVVQTIPQSLRLTQENSESFLDRYFDAHDENWMIRPSDNTLVLTDPFSGSNEKGNREFLRTVRYRREVTIVGDTE